MFYPQSRTQLFTSHAAHISNSFRRAGGLRWPTPPVGRFLPTNVNTVCWKRRVPRKLSDWKQTAESRFRNALNELLTKDCCPGLNEGSSWKADPRQVVVR